MNHGDPNGPGAVYSSQHVLRREAWRWFSAGEFDAAATALVELAARGVLRERELQALIEILVDRGELGSAADRIESAIGERAGRERVDFALELFELRAVIDEPVGKRRAALLLLESVAAANDAAVWAHLQLGDRLRSVEESFETPAQLLDALEQEALAPAETGLPSAAQSRIEEIGHANAANAMLARDAERLLHALGDRLAAYRVERSRGAAQSGSTNSAHIQLQRAPSLASLRIAVVGGYPALRALIGRDLKRAKVADVREIPSSWEGSRVGRDVQATLSGVDVAIILVRQVGHSTSDQVKRAAQRVDVPVVIVDSVGTSGVRRALEQFVSDRLSP